MKYPKNVFFQAALLAHQRNSYAFSMLPEIQGQHIWSITYGLFLPQEHRLATSLVKSGAMPPVLLLYLLLCSAMVEDPV